jgi:hypothetical protein
MTSLSIVETFATTNDIAHSQLKARKGKKIVVDDERHLSCSFLHVSQDSMIKNEQNSATFWDQVQNYFNKSRPTSCAARFVLSFETKWGIIKHDVAKFVGHYTVVLALCESRIGIEHTLLDLYKTKHPKHQTFTFIHVWYVLKDILQWAAL